MPLQITHTPALNNTHVFTGVVIRTHDGTRIVGVVDRRPYSSDRPELHVCLPHQCLPMHIPRHIILEETHFDLPEPPSCVYDMIKQKTGSINTMSEPSMYELSEPWNLHEHGHRDRSRKMPVVGKKRQHRRICDDDEPEVGCGANASSESSVALDEKNLHLRHVITTTGCLSSSSNVSRVSKDVLTSKLQVFNGDSSVVATVAQKYKEIIHSVRLVTQDQEGKTTGEKEDDEDGEDGRPRQDAVWHEMVVSTSAITQLLFALAYKHGLEPYVACRVRPTIMVDNVTRTMHKKAAASKVDARHSLGPTRDKSNYYVGFFPPSWVENRMPPFTFEAYGRCVAIDLIDTIGNEVRMADGTYVQEDRLLELQTHVLSLPHPLQYHVITQAVNYINESIDGICRRCNELTGRVRSARTEWQCANAEHNALRDHLTRLANAHTPSGVEWHRHMLDESVLWVEHDAYASHTASLLARHVRLSIKQRTELRRLPILRQLNEDCFHLIVPTARRYRCPPLTELQQHQGCSIFHCLKFGQDCLTQDEIDACKAALFQFAMQTGSFCYIIGIHEKSGEHRGYGKNLREHVNDVSDLPPAVQNRCKRAADGTIHGCGSLGSKGIVYGPRDPTLATYVPSNRHQRSSTDGAMMKAATLLPSAPTDP